MWHGTVSCFQQSVNQSFWPTSQTLKHMKWDGGLQVKVHRLDREKFIWILQVDEVVKKFQCLLKNWELLLNHTLQMKSFIERNKNVLGNELWVWSWHWSTCKHYIIQKCKNPKFSKSFRGCCYFLIKHPKHPSFAMMMKCKSLITLSCPVNNPSNHTASAVFP